jgi:hypothetical protein
MKKFWISWYQEGFDGRPTVWPLPADVFAGFWVSGYTDTHCTPCALIHAKDIEAAKKHIEEHWMPGMGEYRFENEAEDGWNPGDRFPLCNWSGLDPRK